MKRFLIITLLGQLVMASSASASYTYNVSLAAPNISGGTGNVTATGTITVDMLGNLQSTDVLSYSITIVSDSHPSVVLTLRNSGIFKSDTAFLTATTSGLFVTLNAFSPSAAGPLISINENTPAINQTYLAFTTPTATAVTQLIISNGNTLNDRDVGGTTLGPDGVPYTLGTAAVPEPSSLALLGAAGVLGLGIWQRKRNAL